MTVEELIRLLQKEPKEYTVLLSSNAEEDFVLDVTGVELDPMNGFVYLKGDV